jgi:hypothetical protein
MGGHAHQIAGNSTTLRGQKNIVAQPLLKNYVQMIAQAVLLF